MKTALFNHIEQNPVIAAVQAEEDLQLAIDSKVQVIFLLCANIMNVKELVNRIKAAEKQVFIHMDFLEGIGRDQKAIEYIAKRVAPDGIISTRNSHIKFAKQIGLFAIQRFFLIDNKSYDMAAYSVNTTKPDMIEMMPGVMPSIIERMTQEITTPVIAGGLIRSKNDIMLALQAGAIGASTGKKDLWNL